MPGSLTSLLCAAVGASAFNLPRLVGDVEFEHAAVCSFDENFPGSNGPALLLTSFYPAGQDEVGVIRNIAQMLNGEAGTMEYIDQNAEWPNQADPVPSKAIKSQPTGDFVLSASGFFVSPAKSTGNVTLYDVSQYPSVTRTVLSTPKKQNFYHHATWVDMNGDGLLDVIAARAYKALNPLAHAEGDLVWMEQPATFTPGEPWVERQITGLKGPGVAFVLSDFDDDGKVEVVAAQFFAAQELAIYTCDSASWSDCQNGANVTATVIDNKEGAPFFNVQWVDLNADGKKELLATTNTANGHGAVYAFEQPTNWKTDPWTKHVLATGYKPKKAFLPGRGSPGTAIAFQMQTSDKMPSIIVSADDGGWVDLLVPDQGPFTYSKFRVVNSTDTIGTPAIMDIDGDGYAEVAVPLFAEDKMALYTFAPKK